MCRAQIKRKCWAPYSTSVENSKWTVWEWGPSRAKAHRTKGTTFLELTLPDRETPMKWGESHPSTPSSLSDNQVMLFYHLNVLMVGSLWLSPSANRQQVDFGKDPLHPHHIFLFGTHPLSHHLANSRHLGHRNFQSRYGNKVLMNRLLNSTFPPLIATHLERTRFGVVIEL